MRDSLAPWHLIVLLAVAAALLLPTILYIVMLQKALLRCAPQSRTISPLMLWLSLIPIANLVLNFIVVLGMARTLRNEFFRRGILLDDAGPGQAFGFEMSISLCVSVIPLIGVLAGLACLVLWITYWVKIAGYSRQLERPLAMDPAVI